MSFGGSSGGGGNIADAGDVTLSNPVSGNFLGYDTPTSKWKNLTLAGQAALATTGGLEKMWANYSATGAITLDLTNGNAFRLTLKGNVTLSFAGAVNDMVCSFGLYVKQDPTVGGYTITWPSGVVWAGGTVPSMTATAGATDIYVFETLTGGTTWYGSLVGADFR
jgi:hypothetical protein